MDKVELAAAVAVAAALSAVFMWRVEDLQSQAKRARVAALRSELVAAAAAAKAQCLAGAAVGSGSCPQGAFRMGMGPGEGYVDMISQYPAASMGGIVAMAKLAGLDVQGAFEQGGGVLFMVGGDSECRARYVGARPGGAPSVEVEPGGC